MSDVELDSVAELEHQMGSAEADSRHLTSEALAEIAQIKTLLRVDAEFFIEFFLPEELTSQVPEFHKEIWASMTDETKQRILLAIPRDHAKTTLAKLAVVWYFLFTSHRFCVYLSNTNSIAKNACKDIIGFLKTANFESVYGKVVFEKESDTDSLWIFQLPMGNGRFKKCILRAVGAGQQMRGINIDNQRPDISVVDDVEDNENTDSPLLQKKLDKWIFGPFIKALARQKKIIWLGNMLQKTSLLARLSANPKWNPVVFGSIIKDVATGVLRSLWPERWPIDELISDFHEYRGLGLIETWMCEMMNMPGHGENGFTGDMVHYEPPPTPGGNSIRAAWITVDPAFGENAQNDLTAIVVHVLPEYGPPMVVEYEHSQMNESDMFDHCLRFATKWNAWVWGVEAIAAQRVLITLFKVLLAGKMISNVEILPLMAGKGDPKVARIRAWVALMSTVDERGQPREPQYAIPEGDVEIVTQLTQYNMRKISNKDDLIDSCAYGPQMLDNFMPLIIAQYNGRNQDQQQPKFGRQVADV